MSPTSCESIPLALSDLSKFTLEIRLFGCGAWMYLSKDRSEKGTTAPRAVEVINLRFATDFNTSSCVVYNAVTDKLVITNQLTFDELFFLYWKASLIKRLDDVGDEINIHFKASSPIKWLEYDPTVSLMNFTKVHMDRHGAPVSCGRECVPQD